ncbi:MFS general substrate transporter [Thozetella sp. PMI_491]|nr:MFS general substrate transporter [Thozetella sp. PMI_491]
MSLLSSSGRGIPSPGDAATAGSAANHPTPIPFGGEAGPEPSAEEAQSYLGDFRTRKLPNFPFLYIPFRISAEELRSARPFLWLCIMAVSAKSTSKQVLLYSRVRDMLAQKMVVELDHSLELLLGLLVCIIWGNLQVKGRPFLTLFAQLAVSMAFELGLNKSPSKEPGEMPKYKISSFQTSSSRTMEECRAILGCYVMTSGISFHMRRIDTMTWTDHMSECLQILEDKKEYQTDEILVLLVELQRVIEKARLSPWHRGNLSGNDLQPGPPPSFYIAALESDFNEVKRQVPVSLANNGPSSDALLGFMNHTQLVIHEYSISKSTSFAKSSDFRYLEDRYSCLANIKSFYDHFFTIPPSAYVGFSIFTFLHLSHYSASLYRLSTLEDPAWDKNTVIQTMNVARMWQRTAEHMDQVAAATGMVQDGPEDIYTRLATLCRLASRNWDGSLREHTAIPDPDMQPNNASGELSLEEEFILDALPYITDEFHSLLDVGWYGSAYQLTNACFQPMAGNLYTHFNSKYTFLTFVAIFELGSLVCGLANSSTMLIIGRAVAGLGASGIQNGIFMVVSGRIPLEKRAFAMGIGMGVSQIGFIVGPLFGGLFTQYVSWRWCFYVNLPVGTFAALLIIIFRVPEPIAEPRDGNLILSVLKKLDYPGFVLFASSTIQLLLALQFGGNSYAWSSPTVIGLICGSVATVTAFALWERHKGEGAMLPLSLIRERFLWCSALVMLFGVSNSFCASYYLPIYFQAIKNESPAISGVSLFPNIIAQIVFAVVSGGLVRIVGYYLPWSVLAGVLLSIGSGLISTYSPSTPTSMWVGFQIILGAGRGLGMQMPIVAVQANLEYKQIAIAQSFIMLGHTIGGAVFLTVAQAIFSNSLRSGLYAFSPSVNPEVVLAAGATSFRTVVPASEIAGVLQAYAQAVDHIFYLTTGAAVCSFCFAWGIGWASVKKKAQKRS